MIAKDNMLITKRLDLDMAHALDNYDGKCRFIHGHTFHLSVTLKGEVLHDENSPKDGMVMDFGELKTILKEEISDVFDHSLVLKDTSPYKIIVDFVSGEKVNLLPFQPTSENLLIHFIEKIKGRLPDNIELYSASLQETPSNIAEWRFSDELVFH